MSKAKEVSSKIDHHVLALIELFENNNDMENVDMNNGKYEVKALYLALKMMYVSNK